MQLQIALRIYAANIEPNNRSQFAWGFVWQLNHQFPIGLRKLQRFRIGQQIRLRDLALHAFERKLLRPCKEVDVEAARLGRYAPLLRLFEDRLAALVFLRLAEFAELLAEGRRACAVDRFAVDLQPLPHFAQNVLARLRDDAFGGRADVEQVVAALAGDVHQFEYDVGRLLPMVVVALVSPRVVGRRGNFPDAGHYLIWYAIVARRAVIAFAAQPPVNQAIRLQLAHQLREQLGALFVHQARRVEPDHAERAVLREYLAHLRQRFVSQILIEVFLVVGAEVPCVARAVRLVPILRLRVVEAELDPPFGARSLKLLQRVALEPRGVEDVVFAGLRLEHREAVVMLRCYRQVFHSGVLRHLRPLFGVEFDRVELRGQLLVFLHWDLGAVHDPFADARNLLSLPRPGGNRVEAPVNEQAVFGLAEPFASRVIHLARGVFGADHRDGGAGRGSRLLIGWLIWLLIGLLSCGFKANGDGHCHADQERRHNCPQENGLTD